MEFCSFVSHVILEPIPLKEPKAEILLYRYNLLLRGN